MQLAFIYLLIAHFLSDFTLQRDSWVESRQKDSLRGRGIWYHAGVVLITTELLIGDIDYYWIAISVTFAHLLIDYAKARWTHFGPVSFALDQLLHFFVLAIAAYYLVQNGWQPPAIVPTGKEKMWPTVVCGYLFCFSPANYAIREALHHCHIDNELSEKPSESRKNAVKKTGMIIGSAERFLVLTSILAGSYEAAGLTIAAKSLLRFNDNEGLKTEYVLVGTLLSNVAAVVSALFVLKFGFGVSIMCR